MTVRQTAWVIRANDSVEGVFLGDEAGANAVVERLAQAAFDNLVRSIGHSAVTYKAFRVRQYWRAAQVEVIS